MNYLTYDTTTGEIRTWGTYTQSPPAPAAGCVLVEDADPSIGAWTHYYRGGSPVAYTDAQRAVKTAFPDVPSDWSNSTFEWIARTPA